MRHFFKELPARVEPALVSSGLKIETARFRKVVAAAFAALIVGIGLVWTQPTEAWLAQAPAGAPAYSGAGDVTTFSTFWISATRAFSAATKGNNLLEGCHSTAGVDDGCANIPTSASTGILVPTVVDGVHTCPGAGCNVRTFLDQSSNTYCTTACFFQQTTVANRAALSANVFGTLPGAVFSSGNCYISPSSVATFNEPASFSTFVSFSGAAQGSLFVDHSGNHQLGFHNSSANQVFIYDTNLTAATANDNANNAIQATMDLGAVNGSTINVNGTPTPGTMAGVTAFDQAYVIGTTGSSCTGQPFTGKFGELGVTNALFSGGTITSLSTQQQAFY